MGEINIQVKLTDGSVIWPVQKAMKRFKLGAEESIYLYVTTLLKENAMALINL